MRMVITALSALVVTAGNAAAEDRLVGPGQPYSTIGDALDDAVTGDVVIVSAGTYPEALVTRADGVTIRAVSGDEVVVQTAGRVVDVQHADTAIEGLIIDGDYGDRSPVRVQADGFSLVGSEVRRTTRDCVALGSVSDVRIEESIIHRCLRSSGAGCADSGCRDDAHGVSGSAVRDVTIRNSSIHTFSGDAIQIDPSRNDAGWSNVTVDGCRLYLSPLSEAEGGYAAGVVPGENAIDTKTSAAVSAPAVLTVTDTFAWGFRDGLISNMSAFNIKENVDATFDGVHVYESEIAFRLSGPAQISIANAVLFRLERAVRFEDDVVGVRLVASTFGEEIAEAFDQDSSAPGDVVDPENLLFLASAVPDLAMGGASMAVDTSVFVDVSDDDYHLVAGSSPIDVGAALAEVTRDRDGNARPMGDGHDVGAYEWCPAGACAPAADAGMPDAGGTPDGGGGSDGGGGGDGGGGSDGGGGGDGGGPSGMEDGGCCSVAGRRGRETEALLLLGLLGIVVVWRRRRGPPG